EQPVDVSAERDAHAELRVVRRDAEPGAEQVLERPVRHRLAVGDAAPLDPGLSDEIEDAARALEDGVDELARAREFPVAADEAGGGSLQPAGPRDAEVGDRASRGNRLGLSFERQLLRV